MSASAAAVVLPSLLSRGVCSSALTKHETVVAHAHAAGLYFGK